MKFVMKPFPKRLCGRCRRRDAVVGRLCGHCYAQDVGKFDKESRKHAHRIVVK